MGKFARAKLYCFQQSANFENSARLYYKTCDLEKSTEKSTVSTSIEIQFLQFSLECKAHYVFAKFYILLHNIETSNRSRRAITIASRHFRRCSAIHPEYQSMISLVRARGDIIRLLCFVNTSMNIYIYIYVYIYYF